jgi:cytochrome c-type biogenesis protein
MLDTIFLTVNQWISGSTQYAAVGCFFWGLISVLFSPCHMASIPLIVAYVGGQEKALKPGKAGIYSVAFTGGLFITITLVGFLCALLGRMLGDVGDYWKVAVGALLIWVSLGMLGVEKCSINGRLLYRMNLKGLFGGFLLGVAYGVLSGSCTFGFIAPILAIITVQQKIASGVLFIVLFALGHCLPIVVAGSSIAAIRKIVENTHWQDTGGWFRKGAGAMICLLGVYFIANPFFSI